LILDFRDFLLGIAITAAVAGCVADRPYRLKGIAHEFYPDQSPYSERTAVSADRSYQLSFVEFDEHGDFWDRRQLGRAGEAIGKHRSKPLLLVMFIHGWHNNADDRDPSRDVQTFRCLLSQLALSDSSEGSGGARYLPGMARSFV
jgi:hypothetical protein